MEVAELRIMVTLATPIVLNDRATIRAILALADAPARRALSTDRVIEASPVVVAVKICTVTLVAETEAVDVAIAESDLDGILVK